MTSDDSMVSATRCAVPAFIRVEPAIGSAPVSSQIGCSASSSSGVSRVVGDADGQRARAVGLAQTGERERRRAAGRDRDQRVLVADAVLPQQRRGMLGLVLGAFDGPQQRVVPAGHQEDQPLGRPAEGRHQLGAVLHREPPRGAGAGIDQPPAGAQPLLDRRARRVPGPGARHAPRRRRRTDPRASHRGCLTDSHRSMAE